jgi:hypothetical protein
LLHNCCTFAGQGIIRRGKTCHLHLGIPTRLSRILVRSHLWIFLQTSEWKKAEVRGSLGDNQFQVAPHHEKSEDRHSLSFVAAHPVKTSTTISSPDRAEPPKSSTTIRKTSLMLMSEFREALALRREKVYHILDGYLGEKGIKFDPEDYQETSARLLQAMPDLLEYEADWHLRSGTSSAPSFTILLQFFGNSPYAYFILQTTHSHCLKKSTFLCAGDSPS